MAQDTASGTLDRPPHSWPDLLRQYRHARNIKQAALAQDLGVTQAMVSRWESGGIRPGPRMQARIRALVAETHLAAPLVDWRLFAASQPGIAAILDDRGCFETVSPGFERETGLAARTIVGRSVADLFAGDLPQLFLLLTGAGFFDEKLESAESADRYCRKTANGPDPIGPMQGLHWSHRAEDGAVRWILAAARIDEAEFARARHDFGGQARLIKAR